MLLLILLFSTLSVQQDELPAEENPAYPPHGCENYGLCLAPETLTDEETLSSYYSCPLGGCVCNPGTTGETCETVIPKCTPNPCPTTNGSKYNCVEGIQNYTCVCQPGYTGQNCKTGLQNVCATNPCLNGGTCNSTDNVDYTCKCPTGKVGYRCQYNNPCTNVTCQNGGVCESIFDGADFYCRCKENYQQAYCGKPVYLWSGSPVSEGCFDTNAALADASYYKNITDPKMTMTKCKNFLTSTFDPVYTVFTVAGTSCYLSTVSFLNVSANNMLCKSKCNGDISEDCGNAKHALVYIYDTVVQDPNACDNRTLCNADLDHGVCVDMAPDSNNFLCKCNPQYTGTNCETRISGPCDSNPCLNDGVCKPDYVLKTYTCECVAGYSGKKCEYAPQCGTNPCLHGGTCVENYDGTYKCNCLEFYNGKNCEEIDTCAYNDKCVNGTCNSIANSVVPGSTCTCIPGYTGVFCDENINDCIPNPCKWGTCEDAYMDYNCTCKPGATGKKCDINIPDCVPYNQTVNGVTKTYKNRCMTKDKDAKCIDELASFSCNCSAMYTGEFCDLNIIIKDVLLAVYGSVNLEMIPMLEDLLKNPSQIKDMVPFIVGLQEDDNRTSLSWDYSDMFLWAAFEEKMLDLERDLHKWNDVVLGNCFTFNHRASTLDYNMRSSGIQGGLQVFMKLNTDEYLPWYDTASMLVFVTNEDEYVFSESVRYNAQPAGETLILVRNTKYGRLAGKYGNCVQKPSEVKAYYYDGMYTTDGCLRSCYQDMIYSLCGCMDPRYPVAPNTSTCELVQRPCIDDAVEVSGDPSEWESCKCPLPCNNQQYSVEWHRTKSPLVPTSCSQYSGPNSDKCRGEYEDSALITVTLPRLEFQVFAEVPNMDINRFISNLGGLLGVLMGVCILSFIEVAVLAFHLIVILCSKK